MAFSVQKESKEAQRSQNRDSKQYKAGEEAWTEGQNMGTEKMWNYLCVPHMNNVDGQGFVHAVGESRIQ